MSICQACYTFSPSAHYVDSSKETEHCQLCDGKFVKCVEGEQDG